MNACLSQQTDRVGLAHAALLILADRLKQGGARGCPLTTVGFAPKGLEPGAPPRIPSTPTFITTVMGHVIWDISFDAC